MSEEESCTPFALRRSCARTGLCTPSTVAYLTFDVAPTGYLQKEAPSIGGVVKGIYRFADLLVTQCCFSVLFSPVRCLCWTAGKRAVHFDPLLVGHSTDLPQYDAFVAYVIGDLSAKIYLEEGDAWHSRQPPADNKEKDKWPGWLGSDSVKNPEYLSLACKHLLGGLEEVGAPGPYPGVHLLSNEFNCGTPGEFQRMQQDLQGAKWYTFGGRLKPPKIAKRICKGCIDDDDKEAGAGVCIIYGGILRYDSVWYEANAFIVEHLDTSDPSKSWVAVVFRGTKSSKDVFTDANAKQVPFCPAEELENNEKMRLGDVHSGFYHCLQGIQGRLFELLKAVLEKGRHQTIYFGGHSLGGAMATVSAFAFAVCLHNGFEGFKDLTALGVRPRIGVYTFGSPKCGNPEFTQNFHKYMGHFNNLPDKWPITPAPLPPKAAAAAEVAADDVKLKVEGSEEAPTAEKSEVFAEKSEGDVAAKEAGGEAGGEAAEAPKAPAAAAAPPAAWSSVAVKPQPKKTGIVSYRHVYEVDVVPHGPMYPGVSYAHVKNEIVCERDGAKMFPSEAVKRCLGCMVSLQSTVFERASSHSVGNYALTARELVSWTGPLTTAKNRRIIEKARAELHLATPGAGPQRLFGQSNPGPSTVKAFLCDMDMKVKEDGKDVRVEITDDLVHSVMGLMYMLEREHQRPWAKQELSYALYLCTATPKNVREFYRDMGMAALYFLSYDCPALEERSCVETTLGVMQSCNPSSFGIRRGYLKGKEATSMLTCGLFSDHGEKATDLFWSFVAEAINESREGVNSWLLLYDYRDIKVDVSDKVKRHAEREFKRIEEDLRMLKVKRLTEQMQALQALQARLRTDDPASPSASGARKLDPGAAEHVKKELDELENELENMRTEDRVRESLAAASAAKRKSGRARASVESRGKSGKSRVSSVAMDLDEDDVAAKAKVLFSPKEAISLDEAVLVVALARSQRRRQEKEGKLPVQPEEDEDEEEEEGQGQGRQQ